MTEQPPSRGEIFVVDDDPAVRELKMLYDAVAPLVLPTRAAG